jgi:Holliday junction resolvase-like predicted endonuclease
MFKMAALALSSILISAQALGYSLGVLGLGLFAWLVLALRKALEIRRIRQRFQKGRAGQKAAQKVLERQGFEIISHEHRLCSVVEIDGEPFPYDARIDFIVRKGRKLFGVEVKTGDKATNPLYRPTRRQLLEYSRLLPFDGLFLLDMDTERLLRVGFMESLQRRPLLRWGIAFGLGFAFGLGLRRILGG